MGANALEDAGRVVDDRVVSFGGGAIPIEFVLLKGSPLLGQDVTIKPGMQVNGRVIELLGNGRGFINLAGVKVEAQLPHNVRPGDILKMRVTEADDRLLLKIVDQFQPQGAQDAGPVADAAQAQNLQPLIGFGLPGGATAQLLVDPEDRGEAKKGERGELRTIVLRYDSDLLGQMDVVVRLDDAQIAATVLALPGDPLEAARQGADELRGKLREAADRPAQVTIAGRHQEPVDVQA